MIVRIILGRCIGRELDARRATVPNHPNSLVFKVYTVVPGRGVEQGTFECFNPLELRHLRDVQTTNRGDKYRRIDSLDIFGPIDGSMFNVQMI